jgi:hypothetical protein
LAGTEADWADVLNGDPEGVRSYTFSGSTKLLPRECKNIAPGGIRLADWDNNNKRELVEATVVRFKSKPKDSTGLHSAVWINTANTAFLPVTLFKATKVDEPGWVFGAVLHAAALVAGCKKLFNKAPTPAKEANGRLAVSRGALEAVVGEECPNTIRFSTDWMRQDPEAQAWLDKPPLPADADSTIYPVNQRPIVVGAPASCRPLLLLPPQRQQLPATTATNTAG